MIDKVEIYGLFIYIKLNQNSSVFYVEVARKKFTFTQTKIEIKNEQICKHRTL